MRIDWNSPASIAAFYRVFPERHGALIAWWGRTFPQFKDAIFTAGQMLR